MKINLMKIYLTLAISTVTVFGLECRGGSTKHKCSEKMKIDKKFRNRCVLIIKNIIGNIMWGKISFGTGFIRFSD